MVTKSWLPPPLRGVVKLEIATTMTICTKKIGTRKISTRKVGMRKNGTRNMGTKKMGARKMGARKMGAMMIGARKIGAKIGAKVGAKVGGPALHPHPPHGPDIVARNRKRRRHVCPSSFSSSSQSASRIGISEMINDLMTRILAAYIKPAS